MKNSILKKIGQILFILYTLIVGFLIIREVKPGFLSADESVRIKLATLAPKGTSYHQILQAMGEKWRQVPGGGVMLTIYTDGTMGSEADMVRRMRVGQIQAGMLTVIGLAEIDDSVTALQNLPMVFRSLEEVDYVREKLRSMVEKRLSDKGFITLFWGDAGWVRFFTRQPVLHPDDLKKLKLFAWAGHTTYIDLVKAAGFQPVPLEPTDILTGLQTGLIDAVGSTPFYALAGQFYGPAPHMLEINWAPIVGGTVVTKKVWDTLSPDTQAELLKAATEAGEQIKIKGRAENQESVDAMKKRGLKVQIVTPEVEEEWRKFAESFYPKLRGSIIPADLFDEVQRVLQEYRVGK
jgi:TRAP-type C4-dicarboxylate transport system substrate-binding protein